MKFNLSDIFLQLNRFSTFLLPRLLTQICRDPHSRAYGCCDRNWWHYKMRDFPSIILQQGGYSVYCGSALGAYRDRTSELRELAHASCLFWRKRAVKHGAFEEYYPWEQGYPPLAFSTLAVAKSVASNIVELEEVYDGLAVAAKQLLSRFEAKAGNQQCAGTAALCWLHKLIPDLVPSDQLELVIQKILGCQHEDGWYMEYGASDLGYLSVAMDCLWDAFDATQDRRFIASAAKALSFISLFTAFPSRGAGMHNSRNTDYILPYGISRFLKDPESAEAAANILRRVYDRLEDPAHFLYAIDDRYYCHYTAHSLCRALPLIGSAKNREFKANDEGLEDKFISSTGHFFKHNTPGGSKVLVSGKKGGIFSIYTSGQSLSDYGWLVVKGKKSWVSHWWMDHWRIEHGQNRIKISGFLTPHQTQLSNPQKHMILRLFSLCLGKGIINFLKEKLIFKKGRRSGPVFEREINFMPDALLVIDRIEIQKGGTLHRAPRVSQRYVASANSFHPEDLSLSNACIHLNENKYQEGDLLIIETKYEFRARGNGKNETGYSDSLLQ